MGEGDVLDHAMHVHATYVSGVHFHAGHAHAVCVGFRTPPAPPPPRRRGGLGPVVTFPSSARQAGM